MAYVKPSIKNAVLAFSKNTCAYPGCHNRIINKNGKMIPKYVISNRLRNNWNESYGIKKCIW